MLESHPFGHLIAGNMEDVIGMAHIHVVHHIAYDNGNEASLISQLDEDANVGREIRSLPVIDIP